MTTESGSRFWVWNIDGISYHVEIGQGYEVIYDNGRDSEAEERSVLI